MKLHAVLSVCVGLVLGAAATFAVAQTVTPQTAVERVMAAKQLDRAPQTMEGTGPVSLVTQLDATTSVVMKAPPAKLSSRVQ